ncbi:MAG: hypothetical protein ACRYGC_03640, partial [Janthinobacterium lividum]
DGATGGLKFRPMTLPDRLIEHNAHPAQISDARLGHKDIVATVMTALGRDAARPGELESAARA